MPLEAEHVEQSNSLTLSLAEFQIKDFRSQAIFYSRMAAGFERNDLK